MSEGFPISVQMTKGDRAFASDAPALTFIPATDAPMHETSRKYRWFFGGELAVSLLLHTLVVVALTGVVARQFGQPQVDPISVELVAPPEIETPEPKEQELKIPELEQPKPEVPEADEKQPPEQKQEEKQAPEQKQEEQKPEEKKQEAPPPPPPPPPSEQKSEEKPAEPEQTEEPEEMAPTVMQPVVEFGDTDSGPREALDGTAAEEAEKSDKPEETPAEPEQTAQETEAPEDGQSTEAEPAEVPPAETAEAEETSQPEETQPEETPPEEAQAEQTQPDQPPEAATTEAPEPEAIAETEAPIEDFGTVGPIVTSAMPTPKPAQRPAARSASNAAANSAGGGGNAGRQGPPLAEARQLFSASILGDSRARTAMDGMPPGQRLNLLCMTELRAQLIDWDPARPPEMLPSFRPKAGNVLQPGQAAYGSRGEWYDLNFRCETDKDVKRVVKFSFRIGPPIPPAKWQGRGLPPF